MKRTTLSQDETHAAHALGEAIAQFVKAFTPNQQSVHFPAESLRLLQQLLEQRTHLLDQRTAAPSQFTRPDEQLLSTRMAAKLLNISQRMLWTMSHPRGPIQTVRVGRRVLYPRTELMNWVSENTSR